MKTIVLHVSLNTQYDEKMSDEQPVIESPWKLLPTGKPHISWSEVKEWYDCSFRHKLRHVDKIDLGKPSPVLYFGTANHASCEEFADSRAMKPEIAVDILEKAFAEHQGVKDFDEKTLALMIKQTHSILAEVPDFLEREFPGWSAVKAEHALYQPLSETKPHHAFKGYIDLVLQCPNPKKGSSKPLIWILDYKTTNSFWSADKRADPKMTGQLVSYKHYYMQEIQSDDIRNMRCGFVLLKRTAKPGNHCELVKVSVGDVTRERTLKVINNCVSSIQRGIALKNRDSCKYCDYHKTEYCK